MMDSALPDRQISDGFPAVDFSGDALFLDIDGTLIDIAPTPESVMVPESLKLSLVRVREQLAGALAVISGRTLSAIDDLFAPVKFAAAGAHGAEIRLGPNGEVERYAPILGSADKAALAEIVKLDPRLRLEDKVYTMAIHYRLAPELEDAVFEAVKREVGKLQENLRILRGKAVIEVKHRGFNKGTGLCELMKHFPFAGRRPIFLGDDTTDQDAMEVMPHFAGLGISVGQRLAGAHRQVSSPAEVRRWLAGLAGLNSQMDRS
jgi:trehalose 6-phosphate phosphatase